MRENRRKKDIVVRKVLPDLSINSSETLHTNLKVNNIIHFLKELSETLTWGHRTTFKIY